MFCNTVRPIEQVLCPVCGRAWIDANAADSADSVARAEAEAIRTMSTDSALPIRRSTHRQGRWIPVLIALVAFGGYWLAVSVATDRNTEPPAAQPVPMTLATSTTQSVQTPPNTLPPATTTTAPPPTTATVPPTTTTTTTLPLLRVGEPIALDDLRLGAFALGGFAFGEPADAPLAGLVGSFGQPTAIGVADESWGLCPGDAGRVISFGGLHVITLDAEGTETFAGYMLEPSNDETDGLATFSNAGLASTLQEMDEIYRGFDVVPTAEGVIWIVSSFNDGGTLLWGTAAGQSPDTTLASLASPRPCDGGPTID